MKVLKQKFEHDPANGSVGDCHRTAIASILDLERDEVPHFALGSFDKPELFNALFDKWIHDRGLLQIHYIVNNIEPFFDFMQAMNPDVYYLLGGRSKTNCGHTVVCRGNKIVCDPSERNSSIVAPMADGWYWITHIVPLNMHQGATNGPSEGSRQNQEVPCTVEVPGSS